MKKPVIHEGYVRAAGANIFFKSVGKGPTLLVLHGGPGSDHRDFLPALQPLASHRRLLFIDERGSGRSERLKNRRLYTLDYMVDDLERIRQHFGLKRFSLLGHSFGGLLAQAYAIRDPQGLHRLILAGTAHSAVLFNADFRKIRSALTPVVRARMKAFEKRGIFRADSSYVRGYESLCASILAPYMYVRSSPPAVEPQTYVSGWEVLREMWVRRSDFHVDGNLKGVDFTNKLKLLRVPTLVILGDHDIVSVPSAQLLADTIPDSELVVLSNCGHMMYIDQRKSFNQHVERFLCSRRRARPEKSVATMTLPNRKSP